MLHSAHGRGSLDEGKLSSPRPRLVPDARGPRTLTGDPEPAVPSDLVKVLAGDLLTRWLRILTPPGNAPATASYDHVQEMKAIRSLPTGGMPMGRFAETMGISDRSATAVADRLIRSGTAERARDEDDRRSVRLQPTSAGAVKSEEYWGPREAAIADLIAGVAPEAQAALIEAMDSLLAILGVTPDLPIATLLTPAADRWGMR